MQNWPSLRQYEKESLRKVALPLGGIGTGTVSLGGRGNLQDWEIMNSPGKGFDVFPLDDMIFSAPFFALYTEMQGEKKVRALEGCIDPADLEGPIGCMVPNHGLPRFSNCRFETAYPLGQVHLSDKDIPLDVTLKAFNPLVPGDAEISGVPTAILTYRLKNKTDKTVTASVCGNVVNHIGIDGREYNETWLDTRNYRGSKRNKNIYREEKSLKGIYMSSDGVSRKKESWGTMALATPSEGIVSHRTHWVAVDWGCSTLDFWDDFGENGEISNPSNKGLRSPYDLFSSLAVKRELAPGEETEVTFYLTWHFPNRMHWGHKNKSTIYKWGTNLRANVGNYYTTLYQNAWEVAQRVAENRETWENKTLNFVNTFCNTTLPDVMKESALFNVSTLRTQTFFRTKTGNVYGWEGIHDLEGSCFGSCTHVWNYEQTTPFLFPALSRDMRNTEFFQASRKDGSMSFRVYLPLWLNKFKFFAAAADGQMGAIMKVYREYRISGDKAFLTKIWPRVKKSLEFTWLPGGWDADKDGVMEGCQHNTMDVEYYGPNPQMQAWYLGALRAAEEMAKIVGEADFAAECRSLFENGSAYMDAELFNGEFYEHKIQIPKKIRKGLTADMGTKDLSDPEFQLGKGCLIDQLVGQFMAHVCGLGYLVKKDNVLTTLKSIVKYNFKKDFHTHFNHMRSYAMNDEEGVVLATYPLGGRPKRPFPYCNEVFTGYENMLAAQLLYEGLDKEATCIVKATRDRFDGKKRSPFDEAECGHHYARAMSAWAEVLAYSGFDYDASEKTMHFSAKEGHHFWSTGDAWGTCEIRRQGDKWEVVLSLKEGEIELEIFALKGKGMRGNMDLTLKEDTDNAVITLK